MIGVSRRDRIREGTNVTESIIEEIRRRKLSWFGHISRMEIDRLPARAFYCHVMENAGKEDKEISGSKTRKTSNYGIYNLKMPQPAAKTELHGDS